MCASAGSLSPFLSCASRIAHSPCCQPRRPPPTLFLLHTSNKWNCLGGPYPGCLQDEARLATEGKIGGYQRIPRVFVCWSEPQAQSQVQVTRPLSVQFNASSMIIASIPLRVLCAVGPITQAIPVRYKSELFNEEESAKRGTLENKCILRT